MQPNSTLCNKQYRVKKRLDDTPDEKKNLFGRQYAEKGKPSDISPEHIRLAQQKCGKGIFSLLKDIYRLQRGDGRLTRQEYFLYRLFDDEAYPAEEKARFLSESMHWPMTHQCSDMSWSALTEDKWLSYDFLGKHGVPVPETVAVVDRSLRSFGSVPKVDSVSRLRKLLRNTDALPLFAKPNDGIGSYGTFIVTGGDDTHVFLERSEPVTYEALLDEIVGQQTYLLQPCLRNHSVLSNFSPYLATVRTVNLIKADNVATPFYVAKIPSPDNIADNFWRDGNVLADIDPLNGEIRRAVVRRTQGIEERIEHPGTGNRLVGLQLPFWEALKRVNRICAELFAPVRYQSLDIAITQTGPVVVEVNTGGSFLLPQLATGKGFLTDDIRRFFESCGWQFQN
jgi:hypothetical protein